MRQGYHHTAKARAKISAATKAAMADPAVRQKISERTKAAMAGPEVRQRIKDGMQRAANERDDDMIRLCDV